MSDFIKYKNQEDTLGGISTGVNNSYLIQNDSFNLEQPVDNITAGYDTIFNSESKDSNNLTIFNNTSPDFFNEIKHNENILPVGLRKNQNGDWLTIVLLLAFVLLVSVRAGFQKYISSLFQSVVNYSTSFRMFREKNFSFLHGAFRLEVLFYIVFSVFIYQVLTLQHFAEMNNGLLFFGKTMAVIVVYFLMKKFVYWFLGVVFNSGSETSEFLFNLDNYNRATSIVLFPVVALIAYYPFGSRGIIVILGVIAAGFFYLMSLRRGAIILLRKQFSIFYLFLYLCTLEFLPLLLIYKMVLE